jgi:hypothetical protein
VSTRRASVPFLARVAIACALAALAVVILWAPWQSEGPRHPALLDAPVAAGTSAANIPLVGAQTRVLVRWVARSTGTLTALHLRIQADGSSCRKSGKTEYGLGSGGSWHVTTHPVLADGRPDQTHTFATDNVRPCNAPSAIADVRQGVMRLPMRLSVTRGDEYATVIANDDPDAGNNYTSLNFLFTSTGLLGANGRNERSSFARDAYYGLDPRELVGYSRDGGRTWALPGGPYGTAGGRNFLPTYLQEYSDGRIAGQPYYYAVPASSAPRTMAFHNGRRKWTINTLGAFTPSAGAGTLTLTMDGRERARAKVAGRGMLRAPIRPVAVPPGRTVQVTATGLSIQDVVADTAWGRLMGLQSDSAPWRLEGATDFSHAAPVYPLPRPPG